MLSNSVDRFNGLLASLAIKAPCVAVAKGNITLSGLQTVDGVILASDDRVLCIGQTDSVENGIYDVDTSEWSRSADFDGNRDVVSGTFVTVADQNVGRNPYYQVTTANPITIGTTGINFTLADGPNVSFPLTLAEGAAGLTDNDIDDSFEPGDVRRYGASASASGATNTSAFQNAFDQGTEVGGSKVTSPDGLTFLITATLTALKCNFDFGTSVIRLDATFADTEGLVISGGLADTFYSGRVIVDGNRANVTPIVEAVQINGNAASGSVYHIHGFDCDTVCAAIGNTERIHIYASGNTSGLVATQRLDTASTPDELNWYISGTDCTQFFTKDDETSCRVIFNCEGQTVASAVFPVVITGTKSCSLGGQLRGMVNGSVQVSMGASGLIVFDDLQINSNAGDYPVHIVSCLGVHGSFNVASSTNGIAKIEAISNAGMLSIYGRATGASAIVLGDNAGGEVCNRLTLVAGPGVIDANDVLVMDRCNDCDITLTSSGSITLSGTLTENRLSIPAEMIMSDIAITDTSAGNTVEIDIRGRLTDATLAAYTTPIAGMKCNHNTNNNGLPTHYHSTKGWVDLLSSDGTTGGASSAGVGNQFVEMTIGGVTYKVLHDGTV